MSQWFKWDLGDGDSFVNYNFGNLNLPWLTDFLEFLCLARLRLGAAMSGAITCRPIL